MLRNGAYGMGSPLPFLPLHRVRLDGHAVLRSLEPIQDAGPSRRVRRCRTRGRTRVSGRRRGHPLHADRHRRDLAAAPRPQCHSDRHHLHCGRHRVGHQREQRPCRGRPQQGQPDHRQPQDPHAGQLERDAQLVLEVVAVVPGRRHHAGVPPLQGRRQRPATTGPTPPASSRSTRTSTGPPAKAGSSGTARTPSSSRSEPPSSRPRTPTTTGR